MELLVDPISNYPKKHYKIANKILCGGGGGGGGFLWKLYFRTLLSYGLTLQNQAQKTQPFTHSEYSDLEQPI